MNTQGEAMAEVTDADREKAMQIMAWDPLSYEAFAQAVNEGGDPDDRDSLELVDAIAAALAEEREKARAPFLAVAEEAEQQPKGYQYVAAALIRRAAEVAE